MQKDTNSLTWLQIKSRETVRFQFQRIGETQKNREQK